MRVNTVLQSGRIFGRVGAFHDDKAPRVIDRGYVAGIAEFVPPEFESFKIFKIKQPDIGYSFRVVPACRYYVLYSAPHIRKDEKRGIHQKKNTAFPAKTKHH